MLPTGAGCVVTFFALHAIGRTPAMLNFTAGIMNLRSAIEQANVRKILTSRTFIRLAKLEALEAELSKHATLIYLEDIRKSIDFGDKIIALVKGSMPKVFAAKARRTTQQSSSLRQGRTARQKALFSATQISSPTSSRATRTCRSSRIGASSRRCRCSTRSAC
jgi:hypothetical protein